MARRYGRSDVRRDIAWAGARAADSQWADKQDRLGAAAVPPCTDWEDREADVRDDLLEVLTESVAQVAGLHFDPQCRFIRHPSHICHDRDGEPLRPGTTCWCEANAQVQEQGRMLHLVEDTVA